MGRVAASPVRPHVLAVDAPRASGLRIERSVALIRLAVVGIVALTYFASIGVRRDIGPLAIIVLGLAALYSLWGVAILGGRERPWPQLVAATLIADAILVALWCRATGGATSEFWSLTLFIVLAAGLRYGFARTVGVAVGLALVYAGALALDGRLAASTVVYRAGVIVLTGLAAGLLASQRSTSRTDWRAAEALAAERSVELTQEREEVARLRRVDRARAEFVAVVAHEFRTPLAAILGVLNTIRTHGTSLDHEIREELLEGATSQAGRLARLVDDLLTVSRIEDGALALNLESVEPRRLVADAAQASGTVGIVNVELHRADAVWCDPDAVVRVLTNLLDNARKYSPEGARIVLSVSQDPGAVRFAVRDSGPGIQSADRASVFERFHRLEEGSLKPGAGLGLYISRGLVEAHGGTIAVDEAPGGGAEFSFTIPRRSVTVPEPEKIAAPAVR
jgi:signal transduction histidine kinase